MYSLGSVLYEMLTGEPPHTGGSAQAIIMKIVTEPADPVTKVRKSVPPNVAGAVAKSLEKLAADRFDSAKFFAEALANPGFTLPTTPAVAVGVPVTDWRQRAAVPLAVVALGLGAMALWGWLQTEPAPGVHRQRIVLGDERVGPISMFQTAIANDASAIAYIQGTPAEGANAAFAGSGTGGIWIKERDASNAQLLAGTEDAVTVSFSPEGDWILYGTQAELRRMPRLGGASTRVSELGGGVNGAWLPDETIVFVGWDFRSVYRVSAQGGEAELLVDIGEAVEGVRGAGFVRPVWGADAVLILAGGSADLGPVVVLDLATNEVKSILEEGAAGAWSLATGHLVYGRSGGVFVAPFDVRSLELTGPGVPLLDNVPMVFDMAEIAVTPYGTALYRQGGSSLSLLSMIVEPTWIGEDGSATPVPGMDEFQFSLVGGFSISPDGQRVAYDAVEDDRRADVWIRSLTGSEPPVRLTFEGQVNRRPTWTPDGESVVFISDRDGGHEDVWIRRADGREQARLLLKRDRHIFEALISPDGNWLIYRTDDDGAAGNGDVLAVHLDGDSAEIEVAVTGDQETSPALSPDGRWLAYAKGPDGDKEIFAVPFPNVADGGPYQVSTGGGIEPVWSRSGRELFYRSSGLVAVEVVTEIGFAQRSQRTLFSWPEALVDNYDHRLYQVGSNDREFLFLRPVAPDVEDSGLLVLVENWLEEIQARLKN